MPFSGIDAHLTLQSRQGSSETSVSGYTQAALSQPARLASLFMLSKPAFFTPAENRLWCRRLASRSRKTLTDIPGWGIPLSVVMDAGLEMLTTVTAPQVFCSGE